MDITAILPEVIKQSVLAGVLLFILWVFWDYFKKRQEKTDEQVQKKDDAILALMSDHSAKLLEVQEKNIESNNLLTTTIGKWGERIDLNHKEVTRDLDELKKKVSPRLVNNRPSVSSPTAKA